MNKWISVKDKLPEKYKRVLVNLNGEVFHNKTEIAEFCGNNWYFGDDWSNEYVSQFVSYWMPLPSLPE